MPHLVVVLPGLASRDVLTHLLTQCMAAAVTQHILAAALKGWLGYSLSRSVQSVQNRTVCPGDCDGVLCGAFDQQALGAPHLTTATLYCRQPTCVHDVMPPAVFGVAHALPYPIIILCLTCALLQRLLTRWTGQH